VRPRDAYREGACGYYVVELASGEAVGGPFAVTLLALDVRLALEAVPGAGDFAVVYEYDRELEPAEVPA